MEYAIEQKIKKLSKMYNYFDKKIAIKLLSSMSEEEKTIALQDTKVQNTILKISDVDILRTIFRKSPAFFQEVMFENEFIQDTLISPSRTLNRDELLKNYNKKDYTFSPESLRELEIFLHTIKSDKVHKQLIESKFFQRIIACCYGNQLSKSFFRGINEVKLFYNIINDEEIFKTRNYRRKNIITIFNNVSDHVLLPDDYEKILEKPKDFIRFKGWKLKELEHIYIDEHTLSLLSNEMLEELVEYDNIDINFITNYFKEKLITNITNNNFNFNKLFPDLIKGHYNSFKGIYYIYFKIIIELCQHDETLKENFINYIFEIICKNNNLQEHEISLIKDDLYNKILNDNIKKSDFKKLFYKPDILKTVFYLKFGKISDDMNYLDGISPTQIMCLNVKHINQILNSLKLENEDELSNIYSYAIRLYLVFGLERSLLILNEVYGILNNKFYENLGKLNVENIVMIKEGSKYIPEIPLYFNNFMFANNKSNHFSEMLNNNSSKLNEYWSYLFNNFDELKERCHGEITLKKLNIIFKQLSPTRDIDDVTPDNYRLSENNILNDVCLGNKTKKANEEIYKKLLDVYEKMKKRNESSIPYINGKASNGYSYEMMKLNDPIIFTLGYKCNCCIRICDIAHNHLLYAALCRNGRILLIKDESNNLAAFVVLKRNGEVLILNSIECLHKRKNPKAIEATIEAVNNIVLYSKTKENNGINLVCIGTQSYARPDGKPFPDDIESPTILEKDTKLYEFTDIYHKKLTIIYKNPSLDLHHIKYGNPEHSYKDERNKIIYCDFNAQSNEEIENALKVINAVRYTNSSLETQENFRNCGRYGINMCIYNEDWYLLTTYKGEIFGDYLKFDERAKIEFDIYLNEIQEKLNNKDIAIKKLK